MATGFIAKNTAGQVTTLRRNGSDYSATILGALVRSGNIVIWTDVDGVFSADPRKVRVCPAQAHRLAPAACWPYAWVRGMSGQSMRAGVSESQAQEG